MMVCNMQAHLLLHGHREKCILFCSNTLESSEYKTTHNLCLLDKLCMVKGQRKSVSVQKTIGS